MPRRFRAFAPRFVIWLHKVDVTDAKGGRKVKQRDDRRVALALLETADILLGEARSFSETLLRKALLFPQSLEISADKPAHIHLRKLRLYIL